MKTAVVCGIPLNEFWKMTPWQTFVATEGINEDRATEFRTNCWLAWHNAALPRTEKFPELGEFLGDKKEEVQAIDEAGILAMLKRFEKK